MSRSIEEQLAYDSLVWKKLGFNEDDAQRLEELVNMTDSGTLTGRYTPPSGAHDMVSHPPHYTAHPSGIEHIEVTEHFNFCRGSVIKYIWRAGSKGGPAQEIEDLKKARWYLDREIKRLEAHTILLRGEK